MDELNQTGSLSGMPGTEESVHGVSNSNQEELTEHCILKVRLPNFFRIPALEHCHLALYSSRRFKKTNNLTGEKRPTNNDIWEQFGWPTNLPTKSPVSQQDQSKSNHLLSASLLNVNGHKELGRSFQAERQNLKLIGRKESEKEKIPTEAMQERISRKL